MGFASVVRVVLFSGLIGFVLNCALCLCEFAVCVFWFLPFCWFVVLLCVCVLVSFCEFGMLRMCWIVALAL